MRGGLDGRQRLWPCPEPRSSELQQLADLNAALGQQPVCPFKGSVHAREIHDVEGLNLPPAFGERSALHRGVDRVPAIAVCTTRAPVEAGTSAPLSMNAPAASTFASNSARPGSRPRRRSSHLHRPTSASDSVCPDGIAEVRHDPGRSKCPAQAPRAASRTCPGCPDPLPHPCGNVHFALSMARSRRVSPRTSRRSRSPTICA